MASGGRRDAMAPPRLSLPAPPKPAPPHPTPSHIAWAGLASPRLASPGPEERVVERDPEIMTRPASVVPSRLMVVGSDNKAVAAGLLGPLTEGDALTLYCIALGVSGQRRRALKHHQALVKRTLQIPPCDYSMMTCAAFWASFLAFISRRPSHAAPDKKWVSRRVTESTAKESRWPAPEVTWWRGSTLLANNSQLTGYDKDALATFPAPPPPSASEGQVSTKLSIPALTRDYVQANLTCRAVNNNITAPLSTSLALLLHREYLHHYHHHHHHHCRYRYH
ncbi:hypothetical protein E2C01_060655 [Portunus trituberculatus]|uniref:Ig-like domain-containing protein n=1 Tax=Portunus trituberculatus TaxID=210409 RepID=A0A5B7HB38_PORTR|nr:hypothetical protein [Portunus trituberculatus]